MAHTDKTDPYWVKVVRYGREEHNHTRGVCDYVPGAMHTSNYPRTESTYRMVDGTERTWRRTHLPACADQGYWHEPIWFARCKSGGQRRKYENRLDRRRTRQALSQGEDEIAPYRPRNSAMAWCC